jgi:DNA-binding Lrp family transcriptional regulator
MDKIDLKILSLLQDNARISNSEIARKIGMVPSGIIERIRKLEEHGQKFMREKIGSLPTVTSSRTIIVLETLKESTKLHLPDNI